MRSVSPSDIVRRRRARARQTHGRAPRLARALAVAALLLALAAVFAPAAALAGGAAGLLAFVRDLPDVAALRDLPATYAPSPATTRLYAYDAPDADGLRQPVLLDEIADPRAGGAGWMALGDLPPAVISATLAAIDPLYFDRPSLDLTAAAAEWARTGAVTQAQSPLLAELVSDHLRSVDPPLTPPEGRGIGLPPPLGEGWGEGLPTRLTLQDWFLGWQIESRYGREQALEWTLNTTYYGHLAYGIEAAARVYFGVGAAELTPGQAALLAAVARDPAANPFDAPDAARAGQVAVIEAMARAGFLSDERRGRRAGRTAGPGPAAGQRIGCVRLRPAGPRRTGARPWPGATGARRLRGGDDARSGATGGGRVRRRGRCGWWRPSGWRPGLPVARSAGRRRPDRHRGRRCHARPDYRRYRRSGRQ